MAASSLSPTLAGWTLTVFYAAFALGNLVVGPLADAYGRRPVLLGGLAIFAARTLAALFAPNVDTLLVFRIYQTTAAAGMVLSRAIRARLRRSC